MEYDNKYVIVYENLAIGGFIYVDKIIGCEYKCQSSNYNDTLREDETRFIVRMEVWVKESEKSANYDKTLQIYISPKVKKDSIEESFYREVCKKIVKKVHDYIQKDPDEFLYIDKIAKRAERNLRKKYFATEDEEVSRRIKV